MDILPTEVVFYQTLLLVINFYLKLSNFIINYQSLLKTNNRKLFLSSPTPPSPISLSYVVCPRRSGGVMQRSS